MKKHIILSALALTVSATVFTSCSKIKDAVAVPATFTWSAMDVTLNVPVVTDLSSHDVMGSGTFSYNLDSFIKKQTGDVYGINNIDEFRFHSCTLTMLNPDADNNFGNFETAKASFYTNVNNTAATIGQIDNNPSSYAGVLSIPINNTSNMKSYIPSSGPITIYYSLGGKMRKVTTKTLNVQVHIEYDIKTK